MNEILATELNANIKELLSIIGRLGGSTAAKESLVGFKHSPRPRYVYIGKSDDGRSGWYMLDDSKRQYVEEDSIVGDLCGISTRIAESTEHGDRVKLLIGIRADQKYVIQSGVTTQFAISVLNALGSVPVEDLRRPIRITVRPGDKKVVFGSVSFADIDEKLRADRSLEKQRGENDDAFEKRLILFANDIGERLMSIPASPSRPLPAHSWDDARS